MGAPGKEEDITIFNIFNQPVFPKQEALWQVPLQALSVPIFGALFNASVIVPFQRFSKTENLCLAAAGPVKASGAVGGWLSC